jgi:Zn-dependent oligopeptidase
MLENWIWDKDILKKVSKHYQTGEPLSDDVIDKKIASKRAHQALDTLEQIFRGTLDLLIYTA